MKRLFAFILAFLMLVAFVSCGETPVEPTEATTEPTAEPTTTPAETIAETEPPHVHVYSELKFNETGHWYECPDDGEKTEVEAHIWDEGTVTKEPTYSEGGEKTYVCSVCGEIKTEQTPKITAVSVKEVDCNAIVSPNGKMTEYHVTYEVNLSNGSSKKIILLYQYGTQKTNDRYIREISIYTNTKNQRGLVPKIEEGSELLASFELMDQNDTVFYNSFESWAITTGNGVYDSFMDLSTHKYVTYEGIANFVMHPNTERPVCLEGTEFPDSGCTVVLYLRDPETFECIEGATIKAYVTYNKAALQ